MFDDESFSTKKAHLALEQKNLQHNVLDCPFSGSGAAPLVKVGQRVSSHFQDFRFYNVCSLQLFSDQWAVGAEPCD